MAASVLQFFGLGSAAGSNHSAVSPVVAAATAVAVPGAVAPSTTASSGSNSSSAISRLADPPRRLAPPRKMAVGADARSRPAAPTTAKELLAATAATAAGAGPSASHSQQSAGLSAGSASEPPPPRRRRGRPPKSDRRKSDPQPTHQHPTATTGRADLPPTVSQPQQAPARIGRPPGRRRRSREVVGPDAGESNARAHTRHGSATPGTSTSPTTRSGARGSTRPNTKAFHPRARAAAAAGKHRANRGATAAAAAAAAGTVRVSKRSTKGQKRQYDPADYEWPAPRSAYSNGTLPPTTISSSGSRTVANAGHPALPHATPTVMGTTVVVSTRPVPGGAGKAGKRRRTEAEGQPEAGGAGDGGDAAAAHSPDGPRPSPAAPPRPPRPNWHFREHPTCFYEYGPRSADPAPQAGPAVLVPGCRKFCDLDKRGRPVLDSFLREARPAKRFEDLRDERFLKRHFSLELHESRRRKWGSHPTRFAFEQQRRLERLKQKEEAEAARHQGKPPPEQQQAQEQEPAAPEDTELTSLWPQVSEMDSALYGQLGIQVSSELPVAAFGSLVPCLQRTAFKLPRSYHYLSRRPKGKKRKYSKRQ